MDKSHQWVFKRESLVLGADHVPGFLTLGELVGGPYDKMPPSYVSPSVGGQRNSAKKLSPKPRLFQEEMRVVYNYSVRRQENEELEEA